MWFRTTLSFIALLVIAQRQKEALAFLSLLSPLPEKLICMKSLTMPVAHPVRRKQLEDAETRFFWRLPLSESKLFP